MIIKYSALVKGQKNGNISVKFGSVKVTAPAVSGAEVKRNIKAGQTAFARAKKKIITPGVRIKTAKGVPLFIADPKNPDLLIRKCDGKLERGKFVKGHFTRIP
ncbi:MAG: hypothetical protein PHG91_09845 [Syntrophales bacterium]|nr:hypothetical protein [Syntrophales bacterium]MDD5233685.1 hypothetical protein [Syntrophales bacterium]MDD5532863.1 hypothetical protein [Syntrophales bacterium]HPL64787.1 hypothetical protein [Syntrophales bacterium]